MRYFTLCLYSEGSSDRHFLERVLWRALFDSVSVLNETSEIQEYFIRFEAKPRHLSRAQFILQEVSKLSQQITVIFVHADGGSDASQARKNNCAPSVDEINKLYNNLCSVAVVPVKEMEAWALADEAAVRSATGVKDYRRSKKNPESIEDPKVELAEVIKQSRAMTPASVLLELGECCDLHELRKVKSYQAFEGELGSQLQRMGVR